MVGPTALRIAAGRGWGAALAVLLLLLADSSGARTEPLRWTHPDPAAVSGYNLQVGVLSGVYTTTINLGKPAADSQGVLHFDFAVPTLLVGKVLFISVVAFGNDGSESASSNELRLDPPSSGGGGVPPGGDPGSGGNPLDPHPGAIWTDDFEDEFGSAVSGWVDTGADNSTATNDALYSVVDSSGNRVLSTTNPGTNTHAHVVSGGNWAAYEYRGRMRRQTSGAGLGVTAYSQYTDQDTYYRLRSYNGKAFELSPHPHADCATSKTSVVPQPGTWYHFRLQVEPLSLMNLVRAKIWASGSSEPTGWQVECADTAGSRPGQGTVGVWSMAGGDRHWDDLQVIPLDQLGATGGGSDPGGVPSDPPVDPPVDPGGDPGDGLPGKPGQPVVISP